MANKQTKKTQGKGRDEEVGLLKQAARNEEVGLTSKKKSAK